MTAMLSAFLVVLCSWALLANAKDIVITVGGNTTDDVTTVFKPRTVTGRLGDVIVFNCTFPTLSGPLTSLALPHSHARKPYSYPSTVWVALYSCS